MSDTGTIPDQAAAVLDFWFGDADQSSTRLEQHRRRWFRASRRLDTEIAAHFGDLVERAAAGLDAWAQTPRGTLALIVLLDQFTRNIHRGSAAAFANDTKALRICRVGLERGFDTALPPVERAFFYMPLEHAEDRDAQRLAVEHFERLLADAPATLRRHLQDFLKSVREHREIVDRFGRFPHRNATLGRMTTPDEEAYMADGAQHFGQ